ncbi:EAL domain-containing protein [Crenobacter sp. SG2305]|uniref:sensor domain-containing phosphodiesterase n=1 Tax=Crenobacter oryzisoli TaxID=3056844 RepID=UPI0025AB4695|nr:EAL domain-containing protein [Crenobacter sp. SG2305]MDN0084337.1 EAL domain-containing protein [Crenobacter sp. SG2305]
MSTPPPEHGSPATANCRFQPIYSLSHRRSVALEALSPSVDQDPTSCLLSSYCREFALLERTPRWLMIKPAPVSFASAEARAALLETLEAHQLPSHRIVIAVSDAALEQSPELIDALVALKQAGFLLAIDDFGVGPTQLARLSQLEPDLVKFDHALLENAAEPGRNRNLLTRLVHLMHEMGALVVLTGVHNEDNLLIALESGGDLVQGDYVAEPAATPEDDAAITPRIDARWDQLMNRELLTRKLTRRHLELARQAFVQSAIALMQGTPFTQAATPMLALPDVTRAFLLDQEGRQLGGNLNRQRNGNGNRDDKFSPLTDTTGAIWSRRAYFQHAIDQPGVLYMSEPYLSMTDTRRCITLSMAIEIDETLHVLCTDLLVRH